MRLARASVQGTTLMANRAAARPRKIAWKRWPFLYRHSMIPAKNVMRPYAATFPIVVMCMLIFLL